MDENDLDDFSGAILNLLEEDLEKLLRYGQLRELSKLWRRVNMVVTIRVSPDTYELLRELRDRRRVSFNRLLKQLAEKELNEKREKIIARKHLKNAKE